jgi:dipeptidyl-peptidase-4
MFILLVALLAADADLQFLKDLSETRSWRLGRPTEVHVTPDGSRVLFLRTPPRKPENRLYSFDVKTAQVRELITPEEVLKGVEEQLSPEERARRERMRVTLRGFTSFDLSEDGALVLVTLSGHAYVLPTAGGAAREVAGPDEKGNPIFDPRLSPDGKSVSFVRDGELWVAPVGGQARRLTSGATATRTHAQAEFVAQEELNRFTGYWWSPDSRSLVYEEADLSGVEKLDFTDPAHPEKPAGETRYPRPGKPNARISFAIISAQGGKATWIDYDHKEWEYVSQVEWPKGGPLQLIVLTRDQKDEALLSVDPRTGKTRQLLREHDDAWLNAEHEFRWLRDGSGFLWATERNGGWQLELHAPDGALQRELTSPDFGFYEVLHVDLAARQVVVLRKAEPVDAQLFAIPLAGGEPRALTQGPDNHNAVYARDAAAHVRFTLPQDSYAKLEVVRADGSIAGELPAVNETPPFDVRLEVAKRGDFWTAIIRPHDFDPKRKYPVLVQVYGGPHVNVVRRAALSYIPDQWVADHGFIVVRADGRGTPGRGRAWERAIEKKLGEVPLEDQVAALRAMAAAEPAMDLTRVGVEGHSYGGYMASLAVMRRPDVFHAAVAGAPVADFMNYDTCYSERYLGVPPPAGDSDAYPRNSVLAYAKDLQRPLLLMHGTADDNVHFSESLLLSDALFRAGHSARVQFLPFAGQTHQFYEPVLMQRYWKRIFDFLETNLTGKGTR